MFEEVLNKYKHKGNFSFNATESLQEKCNAPTDKGGVYLIYKNKISDETLIYIGSSGQKKNGTIKVRKSGLGGMKDRIVNGYHPKFGKIKRKISFPIHMKAENILEIKINWWVTYDKNNADFPTEVENALVKKYLEKLYKLPDWHI